MVVINIESMFWEMENTMANNFSGTKEERFEKAKKQFLESVEESIEANKEDLLKIKI